MVTKFLEPWVLFPGNLILLLALLSWWLWRSGRLLRRWGRPPRGVPVSAFALMTMALLMYLASTTVVGGRIMYRWERQVEPAPVEELRTAEAIAVLGGGVIMESPGETQLSALTADRSDLAISAANAALSVEATARTLQGIRLAHALDLPLIASGGRVLTTDAVPPEAIVTGALAGSLGVPGEQILTEPESRTTAENARNIASRYRVRRVVLVTSGWHMRRARAAFAAAGIETVAAPAAFRQDGRPLSPLMFLPEAGNLDDVATVLREAIGIAWYRMTL